MDTSAVRRRRARRGLWRLGGRRDGGSSVPSPLAGRILGAGSCSSKGELPSWIHPAESAVNGNPDWESGLTERVGRHGPATAGGLSDPVTPSTTGFSDDGNRVLAENRVEDGEEAGQETTRGIHTAPCIGRDRDSAEV